jgi:hypothetical protein
MARQRKSNPPDQTALEKIHRFLDEAGDTTFFGKGRVPMLGQDGVSLSFGLGMVKFAAPVAEVREQVVNHCRAVEADAYLNRIPSVVKRVQSGGFFFHAKDDSPEVRERLFKWIHQTDWSLEMVVGRKIPALFAKKHNANDSEFYADLLSHLLKKTNLNVASGRSSISPNGINPPRITFWRFGTGPAKGHRTFCQETERGGNFFRSGFQRAKPHAPSRCLPCRIIWRGPFSACLSVAKPATTNSCASEFRWWWTSTTRRNTREVGTITRPSVR